MPAAAIYYQPAAAADRTAAQPAPGDAPSRRRPASAGLLDVADVLGRRGITHRLRGRVTVPEENAAAALEVMSRFAADPRWLIYLPPTMPPARQRQARPAGASGGRA